MRISDWSSDVCSSDLVELVDKRFFVAIHIVNHLLCGGLGLDRVPMPVRNAVAEFLTDEPSDQILLDYIAACRVPSTEAIRALLNMRSEERRVVKEFVSTCRSRWSPFH